MLTLPLQDIPEERLKSSEKVVSESSHFDNISKSFYVTLCPLNEATYLTTQGGFARHVNAL